MNFKRKESSFISLLPIERNEKGAISSLGLVLFMVLLTLTLAHYLTIVKGVQTVEERAKSYLCLRNFLKKTTSQMKIQKRLNQIISALNMAITMAILKPPLKVALMTKKKLTIKSSQFFYLRYIKDIISSHYCSLKGKGHALNTPFKTRGIWLQRSPLGHTMDKKKWHFFIPGKRFVLQGQLRNKEKLTWDVQEIKRDRSLLKRSYGVQHYRFLF